MGDGKICVSVPLWFPAFQGHLRQTSLTVLPLKSSPGVLAKSAPGWECTATDIGASGATGGLQEITHFNSTFSQRLRILSLFHRHDKWIS